MKITPTSLAFTVLLGALASLPALSIDISAPTLVRLPDALLTSALVAGLTLSLFMVGFAIGQLVGGFYSDFYGRRPVLLTSLLLYVASGIGCLLSGSGMALVTARFAQGIGSGACSVIAFAMVQDLFKGDEARSKRSYVTVVFGAIPIVAPALGVVVCGQGGWRAVHGLLAFAGAALLVLVWLGVEESKSFQPKDKVAKWSGAGMASLFNDQQFLGLTLANALSYGAIFAYIAGSPLVVMGQMDLPPAVYAELFAVTAVALTCGAWTSGRLSRRGIQAESLLGPSFLAAALAAVLLAACCWWEVPAGLLMPLLLIICFSRGVIAPNLQHLAVEGRSQQAGVASAAIGISQLLSGALGSAAVTALRPDLSQLAVAGPMAILGVGAALVWGWTCSRR